MKPKEFLRAIGLAATLVAGANQASAQTVIAEMDTGVTITPDIASNIVPGGFDFVNNDSDFSDNTSVQHGSAVARVLVAVDPQNFVLPFKTIDSNFTPNRAAVDAAYTQAAGNADVRIINHSNGNVNPASPQSVVNAANAGKIIVVSAGNNGTANPEGDALVVPSLGGRGIIVGGANLSYDGIAGFSNRAGAYANFYILAPPQNQFTEAVGTSMAAPHVSGVAAQILSQAPFLSAEEVVDLILSTATDIGAPGVDAETGHGLLNAPAALAPVGDLKAPSSSGGGGGGSGAAVAAAALVVGGAVGYALIQRNKGLKKTLVLDRYGRGYTTNLEAVTSVRSATPDMEQMLNSINQRAGQTSHQSGDRTLTASITRSFSPEPGSRPVSGLALIDAEPQYTPTLSIRGKSAHDSFQFDFNDSGKSAFGAANLLGDHGIPNEFRTSDTFSAPYFGFSDSSVATSFGRRLNRGFELKYGLALTDDQAQYGLKSDGALFEGTYTGDRYALNLQFGWLQEDGSLLGGASQGAFSVDKTRTLSLGVSGLYRLSNRVDLIGSYTEGYSRVNENPNALLHNFSPLRSRTFGTGLISHRLFQRDDQLGFAVSRPLYVTSGSADLDIPYAQDASGRVYADRVHTSLAPIATETMYEAFYRFSLGGRTHLTTYLQYRDHPDHNAFAAGETTVFAAIQHRFQTM